MRQFVLASARSFPIVVGRNSAFVPGPTNFLVGEGDLFPLGHLHRELRASVGHAEADRADVGVCHANGEMVPFDAGLVWRKKLQLEALDVFVGSEDAVEQRRGTIEDLRHDKRLVRAFARGSSAGGIARAYDFVHGGDDRNGAFAPFLGDRSQNGALSLRNDFEVRVQGHGGFASDAAGDAKSLMVFDQCNNGKKAAVVQKKPGGP